LPQVPQKSAVQSEPVAAARIAKLEAELAALRDSVRSLTELVATLYAERNARNVTPVTGGRNAVTRNANAERQKAYRARKKASQSE
jgi:hypothetical protein